MEVKELANTIQTVADNYAKDFDVPYSADWFVMKLQEELGELVQAHLILSHRTRRKPTSEVEARTRLAEEIADVFSYVLLFAHEVNIDIEAAVKEKWFSYLTQNQE